MPEKTMERRVERLELLVAQQGYIILILLPAFAFDTAAVLWLWQERGTPNFDHIAVALTVFQTLFGIAALYGFWALRGLTKERAEERAEEVTTAYMRASAPAVIAREMAQFKQAFSREDPISDEAINSMVDAFGQEEATEDGRSDADRRPPSD